jgi:hypothetical protein
LKKLLLLLLLVGIFSATAPSLSLAADDPANRPGHRNIGDEEIEPKDPALATLFSVMPGLLFHGFGSYYAGDYEWGNKMLVMEIFGGGLALWGHNLIHNPGAWDPYFGGADNSQQAGYWVKAGGVTLLALSWIGDVAYASEAADSWNKDHQMQFQMDSYDGTGARIMIASRF